MFNLYVSDSSFDVHSIVVSIAVLFMLYFSSRPILIIFSEDDDAWIRSSQQKLSSISV